MPEAGRAGEHQRPQAVATGAPGGGLARGGTRHREGGDAGRKQARAPAGRYRSGPGRVRVQGWKLPANTRSWVASNQVSSFAQGQRCVLRRALADLVGRRGAMAAVAGADLAGLHGQPVALAHHRLAVRGIDLPGQGAPGRHEHRHRAVRGDRHRAGRATRVAGIETHGGGIVEPARQHAAARSRIGSAAVAAHLVALDHLEVGDVVDLAGAGDGLRAAGHAQVERLLAIRAIAGGGIAHHHQAQVPGLQERLQRVQAAAGLGEGGGFGRFQARVADHGRAWPGAHRHRRELHIGPL